MKRVYIILSVITCTFCTNISFCQNKQIDSLLLALKKTKEDTNRVNTLNTLSYLLNFKPDHINSIQRANEAISLSEKIRFIKGKAVAYYNMALANSFLGNYPEAEKSNFLSLKMYEELKDKYGIANSLLNIGGCFYTQNNQEEALKYWAASLKICEEIGDKEDIAYLYNNIGAIEREQGNHTEALKKHAAALKIFEELGHQGSNIAFTYQCLGDDYEKQGDIEYSKGDKENSVNMFSEALKNYMAALKMWEKGGNDYIISNYKLAVGNIYTKLNKISEARKYLENGLQMAKSIENKEDLREGYLYFSHFDSLLGNYKKAYEHYKLHITYRDSLINEETKKTSLQAGMQYEFDKKEDSLKQKQILTDTNLQTQKKQRYFYWGGLFMLGLLSFFVFLNFRNQKKINRLADDAHAKEKAELELQSLRAQLNPHFMFNSLNAIQELILLEENEKSQSYLARFSKLLRMLLENAERPFIPLQREIEFLHLYLSLENLRIPDLQHSVTVDPAIDTEQTMIPNMILQPYIENAIWHGLSHKQSNRRLQIRISKDNGFIKYEIEDNGVGRKKSAELKSLYRKEHKSKGMELLSKRFKLLAKEYGSDIETTITDVMNNEAVGGTLIIIKVPDEITIKK